MSRPRPGTTPPKKPRRWLARGRNRPSKRLRARSGALLAAPSAPRVIASASPAGRSSSGVRRHVGKRLGYLPAVLLRAPRSRNERPSPPRRRPRRWRHWCGSRRRRGPRCALAESVAPPPPPPRRDRRHPERLLRGPRPLARRRLPARRRPPARRHLPVLRLRGPRATLRGPCLPPRHPMIHPPWPALAAPPATLRPWPGRPPSRLGGRRADPECGVTASRRPSG